MSGLESHAEHDPVGIPFLSAARPVSDPLMNNKDNSNVRNRCGPGNAHFTQTSLPVDFPFFATYKLN